jgi:hypothetical protein
MIEPRCLTGEEGEPPLFRECFVARSNGFEVAIVFDVRLYVWTAQKKLYNRFNKLWRRGRFSRRTRDLAHELNQSHGREARLDPADTPLPTPPQPSRPIKRDPPAPSPHRNPISHPAIRSSNAVAADAVRTASTPGRIDPRQQRY